eukprot:gene8376-6540_t
MATGDAAGSGQGTASKIEQRRDRQFREFMELEAMYAKLAMESGGKGLRELQAMKQSGMKYLKERHADDNLIKNDQPYKNLFNGVSMTQQFNHQRKRSQQR